MEKMFPQRKPSVSVLFLLFLSLLLGTGFLSYSFFLPRYIEKKILPDLGRQLSSSLSGTVYNMGLSSADLGGFILGDRQKPLASIGLIHADYSLSSLLVNKKLKAIRINDLWLNLKVSDGKFIIPGLDQEKFGSQQTDPNISKQPDTISLPVTADSFQIHNGLISLLYEDEHILIPFELQANIQKKKEITDLPLYRFILQIQPQGEHIAVEGLIDLADNKGSFSLEAPSFDLNKIISMAGITPETIIVGDSSVAGKASFSLMPFQLLEAMITSNPEPVIFRQTPVRFGSTAEMTDEAAAISFNFRKEQDLWLMKTRVAISEPLTATLELAGSATREEGHVHGSGNIVLKDFKQHDTLEHQSLLALKNLQDIQGDFVIDLAKNGEWQATIENSGTKTQKNQTKALHVQFDTATLTTGSPTFVFQGRGNANRNELEGSIIIPRVQVEYNEAEMHTPRLSIQASYRQGKNQDRQNAASGDLNLTVHDTQFEKNGMSGKADISLQAYLKQQLTSDIGSLQTTGTITISKAEVFHADNSIKVKAIEGIIPWQWPVSGKEISGEIKAANMSFDKIDLGSFRADLRLKEKTYYLEGSYTSSLLQEIIANVSGKAEITGSGLQAELAAQIDPTPLKSVHLGKFHPSLDNSYFSGMLGFESSMHFDASDFDGRMQVRVQQGRFELPEKQYDVQDIDISLVLPSLPDLRSSPAQKILFRKASAGNIVFEDGMIIWQLESPESIFIEEGMFRWAGGRIFTNALRLSPDMKNLSFTIFCDRLRLAELLEQFGVSNAEGEGTVSGRIPVTVGSNTVHFEDGFLYSSPGQGGSVKVAAFDMLAAGIPKNTPQFAQVDFAAEALKNFSYNWVKLLFNTEGEELIMQMQMDGKPVQSLPFRYDSNTGMLQRIENGGQGINQAIRLDVNFRLPLNRFLGYSGKIQDIMDNIK